MNNKMSIERIADRLDTLAEITPNKSKMALERIAEALENLADVTAENGKASLERIAEAVEQYSGGGGSSDFSTAKVTLINSDTSTVYDANLISLIDDKIVPNTFTVYEPVDVTLILYKGLTVLEIAQFASVQEFVGVTGDIEVDFVNMALRVTGDGTVTLRGSNVQ